MEKAWGEGLGEPFRPMGKSIWLEFPGSEDLLLEGITRIEFKEGGILFHSVLWETISIQNRLERVALREGKLAFRFEPQRKWTGLRNRLTPETTEG
ncbi:MAG: CooT family nickel-binding protein [Candidatus Manganitrophus sp.]|nr:CooT family nickel-binding protein [Candidatus Manganitrophus sp.]MDC4225583.1 CooT family nickel-binding protein [Candidatus Manganitrophus sp.]WDT73067.1 MAG: CooT family nickel-binding protein [Candidatus Manganitrophus sp.]WDT74726.1 MAG: CooT family nickel-binding protein [Candidatus Manganitrophus sp.]WDT79400.1 MAG: CooT family nickel-binding protein [Candidatus Manganitrophus sp.]